MARMYQQFQYTIERMLVTLFCQVDFGAAGAPTLDTGTSKGVESVTRTGAGTYDIVFQDKFFALIDLQAMFQAAAAEDLDWQISAVNLATKTITVKSRAAAADTDPSNGSKVYFSISFRNTSVSR